jgi:hypothetical protein
MLMPVQQLSAAKQYDKNAGLSNKIKLLETARLVRECLYQNQSIHQNHDKSDSEFFDYGGSGKSNKVNIVSAIFHSENVTNWWNPAHWGLDDPASVIGDDSQGGDGTGKVKCGSNLYKYFKSLWDISGRQLLCSGVATKYYTEGYVVGSKGYPDNTCLNGEKDWDYDSNFVNGKTMGDRFNAAFKRLTGTDPAAMYRDDPILRYGYMNYQLAYCSNVGLMTASDIQGVKDNEEEMQKGWHVNEGSDKWPIVTPNSDGSGMGQTKSCRDALALMTFDGDIYQDYLKASIEKHGPGLCASKFPVAGSQIPPTVVAQRAACLEGLRHSNDPDFCANTYDSEDKKTEYEACVIGHDSITNIPASGQSYTDEEQASLGDNDEEEPTCEANAASFGWIICPTIDALSGAVGWIMDKITDSLNYQSINDSEGGKAIKAAWGAFVPLANIAFAIVFLIVIYSAAIGGGTGGKPGV